MRVPSGVVLAGVALHLVLTAELSLLGQARKIKTVEKEIMELHTSILRKLEDMP